MANPHKPTRACLGCGLPRRATTCHDVPQLCALWRDEASLHVHRQNMDKYGPFISVRFCAHVDASCADMNYMYIYVYICIYVYMYICICVYVYMCICVYVYMCVCVTYVMRKIKSSCNKSCFGLCLLIWNISISMGILIYVHVWVIVYIYIIYILYLYIYIYIIYINIYIYYIYIYYIYIIYI